MDKIVVGGKGAKDYQLFQKEESTYQCKPVSYTRRWDLTDRTKAYFDMSQIDSHVKIVLKKERSVEMLSMSSDSNEEDEDVDAPCQTNQGNEAKPRRNSKERRASQSHKPGESTFWDEMQQVRKDLGW